MNNGHILDQKKFGGACVFTASGCDKKKGKCQFAPPHANGKPRKNHTCPEENQSRWQCALSRIYWSAEEAAASKNFPFVNPEYVPHKELAQLIIDRCTENDLAKTPQPIPKPVTVFDANEPSLYYGDDIVLYLHSIARNLRDSNGALRIQEPDLGRLLELDNARAIANALDQHLTDFERRKLGAHLKNWTAKVRKPVTLSDYLHEE